MVSVILPIDEHIVMYDQYSWALGYMMSSILIWKISWIVLSPNGTWRNLYLLRCVLNVVRSEACSCQVHSKESFVAVHLGKFGHSCDYMAYLLKGWSLVILMDDGFVQVLWVEAHPQLAVCFLGVCERADPWWGLSLFGDDSLMHHLSQLLFWSPPCTW